jgi:hypothetical protein
MWHWRLRASHERTCCRCHACCRAASADSSCRDSRHPSGRDPPRAAVDAVFPSAVSSKYSNESAGKARMHTCLDQYNANKTGNGNGGLKWIEKGGGYYSECNKRLKG